MSILRMLESHPRPVGEPEALAHAIAETVTCAAVCSGCADACLAEPAREKLLHCISLNLDCADICTALTHVGMRRTGGALTTRALLDLCASICGDCADECEAHADRHLHCALCAAVCRKCELACREARAAA